MKPYPKRLRKPWPKVSYWYHPESDSYLTLNEPTDNQVMELTEISKQQYDDAMWLEGFLSP